MHTILKYVIALCVITSLLAACGKKDKSDRPQDSSAAPQDTVEEFEDSGEFDSVASEAPRYTFFNIDSLRDILNTGKHQVDQILDDPSRLKGYINTLSGNDPASIPYAIHYIKHHPAPAGSATYDTLYKEFKSLYYLVAVAYSSAVSGPTLAPVLEKPQDDPELRNLKEYFKLYSLTVYPQDMYNYVDADPGLYAEIFHMKGSPELQYYLYLQSKDRSEGFGSDDGMIISFDQLYQRIETWGLFIAAHPNFLLTQDVLTSYRGYLYALLTGDNNSPIFNSGNQSILPEIKTLYEFIMATAKDPVSKKIVTDYYHFLEKNDFKKTEEVNTFLDKYDIPSLFKQPV